MLHGSNPGYTHHPLCPPCLFGDKRRNFSYGKRFLAENP